MSGSSKRGEKCQHLRHFPIGKLDFVKRRDLLISEKLFRPRVDEFAAYGHDGRKSDFLDREPEMLESAWVVPELTFIDGIDEKHPLFFVQDCLAGLSKCLVGNMILTELSIG